MEKPKKERGTKGVTFKLVSASYADPRVASNPAQRTLVLKTSQNDAWKKRNKSVIPKEFIAMINPVDFGIHDKLPKSQKDELIKEIYSSREEYEQIAAKFAATNASFKPKEEDLDGDCYFPKDGYDYSQHLATITPQNFIPAVRTTVEEKIDSSTLESANDFPTLQDAGKATAEDPELAEVLKALDEDTSDLEQMDDDFVTKAMDNEDPDTFVDENELLWGGYKPMNMALIESNQLFGADENEYEVSGYDEIDNQRDVEEDPYIEQDEPLEQDLPHSLKEILEKEDWGTDAYEKDTMDVLDPQGDMNETILHLIEQASDTDNSEDEEYQYSSDESEQWDVETVLTKYTNATNHPQRIRTNVVRKIKNMEKQEVAKGAVAPADDVEYVQLPPIVTTRNRNETPEERRARKAQVKQAKAMITRMKKENKEALKNAKKKAMENNSIGSYDVVNGVKYIRLK